MMGERQTDHPALFYEFSLERHVPGDHLLRSIDRFVDLGDIREQLRPFYSDTGRPSIDPELMIRMLLNTTTSMGRLTLNVLLSFAQFEREVTSERIRDKIAASKRKGLWVGGMVPLGYHV